MKFWKIPPSIRTVRRSIRRLAHFTPPAWMKAAVDKAGDTPIKPGNRSHSRRSKTKRTWLPRWLACTIRASASFSAFGRSADPDKATMTIADVDQGGLGLPDKSYYLEAKDEKTRAEICRAHFAHVSAHRRFAARMRTRRPKRS